MVRFPSLAPYEAAKENGTIALLGSQRIGLYNRIALQRDLLLSVYEHWFEELAAVDAFRKRFTYSESSGVIGGLRAVLCSARGTTRKPATATIEIIRTAPRTTKPRLFFQSMLP